MPAGGPGSTLVFQGPLSTAKSEPRDLFRSPHSRTGCGLKAEFENYLNDSGKNNLSSKLLTGPKARKVKREPKVKKG